jgi:DNA-binding transcriptional LysR family regulator
MNQFPGVKIRLHERVQTALFETLVDGHIDCAVLLASDRHKDIETLAIGREQLCLAIHPSHRLASLDVVDATMLSNEALIAVPKDMGGPMAEACQTYFRQSNSVMNVVLETNAQHTIVNLVRQKLGVALVLSSMQSSGQSGVVFKQLSNPPCLDYVLAWRRENTNPALVSLKTCLQPI